MTDPARTPAHVAATAALESYRGIRGFNGRERWHDLPAADVVALVADALALHRVGTLVAIDADSIAFDEGGDAIAGGWVTHVHETGEVNVGHLCRMEADPDEEQDGRGWRWGWIEQTFPIADLKPMTGGDLREVQEALVAAMRAASERDRYRARLTSLATLARAVLIEEWSRTGVDQWDEEDERERLRLYVTDVEEEERRRDDELLAAPSAAVATAVGPLTARDARLVIGALVAAADANSSDELDDGDLDGAVGRLRALALSGGGR